MSTILKNKCSGEFRHPDLFKWEILKKLNNDNVIECADMICQVISKLNGATNFFYNILKNNIECQDRIRKLEEQKKTEKCSNCVTLKKKLDVNNRKIQTLADIFGHITKTDGHLHNMKNVSRVHDIVTQIIDDTPRNNYDSGGESPQYKRKLRLCKENNYENNLKDVPVKSDIEIIKSETPKKKIKLIMQSPLNQEASEGMEEMATSPILKKSRRNITSTSECTKSPLSNLSNRLLENCETTPNKSPYSKECVSKEKNVKTSSPSLLGKTSDTELTPSPIKHQIMVKKENCEESENKEEKRSSLSLLQGSKPSKSDKIRKSPSSKKLKQARLTFSKPKLREPYDVSMGDNFGGGMRKFSVDSVASLEDEEEMLKIALQLSLNECKIRSPSIPNVEDDDIIDASPANQEKPVTKRRTHRVQVHRSEISTIKSEQKGSGDNANVYDNEETMMIDSQEADEHKSRLENKKNQFRESNSLLSLKNSKSEKKTSTPSKMLTKRNISPLPDYPHAEPVVRKKAEKKKLQGWACKKCKDFYERAYEGNEQMIKEKMNECSRHRGNFDPIRMDTPAGFWDLKMPPTQDTEAFNKRNNQSQC